MSGRVSELVSERVSGVSDRVSKSVSERVSADLPTYHDGFP